MNDRPWRQPYGCETEPGLAGAFIEGSCLLPYKSHMRARVFLAFLLGSLSLLAANIAVPAAAQPRESRDGIQPLDRLLPGIRRDHPGNFYDAEGPTYGPSGNPHYHLKWMTPEGRVIWYDADARSGRVLRSSPGRDSFDSGDRPSVDRYPPYTAEPYDRGYGRARERERNANPPPGFGSGARYGSPYGGWRGGRGDGGGGRGGGDHGGGGRGGGGHGGRGRH
jgi:hypothetical protein